MTLDKIPGSIQFHSCYMKNSKESEEICAVVLGSRDQDFPLSIYEKLSKTTMKALTKFHETQGMVHTALCIKSTHIGSLF